MKKIILIFAVFFTVFILGCKSESFDFGVAKIVETNAKYHSSMESFPADKTAVDSMILEFRELQKIKISDSKEAYDLAIKYRISSLESGKFNILANEFGNTGITDDGFSCKPKPLIIEASDLRNKSAQKGFEAVNLLHELIEKYPNEAQKLSLSLKTAIFQNATAYRTWEQARKDARTIERFCPDEKVLEFYKEEFRSKNIMTDEEINSLDYETAAKKWRELRGR